MVSAGAALLDRGGGAGWASQAPLTSAAATPATAPQIRVHIGVAIGCNTLGALAMN